MGGAETVKIGLRSRILIIALGVMLLSLAAISYTFSHYHSLRQTEALQTNALAIAETLAQQLDRITDLGVQPDQLQGFDVQCREAAAANKGLLFASVVSTDGKVLFHNDPTWIGRQLDYADMSDVYRNRDRKQVFVTPHGNLAALVPVIDPGGVIVARVTVGFSHDLVVQERTRMLWSTLLISVGTVGVGMLLLYIALSRYVIQPVMAVIDVIRKIREEGYGANRNVSGEGELDILVRGFNELIVDVAQNERELLAAKEASDSANRAKMEFLAVMSHEVRTPIHAMLGMAELLQETSLNEKQQRYAMRIHEAGQGLIAIVNGILDYSKLEAGRLKIQSVPFSLRQTVSNSTNVAIELARAKGLSLTLAVDEAVPDQLIGDPWRIGQVLTNLLGNAMKFTEQGGIQVHISQSAGMLCLSVCDTGPGIDPAFLDHIFEPFSQADSSLSRRHGGTGLGLAIVRQLCEAMGGVVGVQSQEGKGTCFWVELPLKVATGNSMQQRQTNRDSHGHQ